MNDADREILNHFSRTRAKTIELAERVPADLLERTADGESHPLCWLFRHIAGGCDWWMHFVMRDGKGGPPAELRSDRDAIVAAFHASRERVMAFFEADHGQAMNRTFSFKEKDGSIATFVGRDRVLYLTDHEIHHRGKIVLALRLWGFDEIPFLPY